MPGWSWKKHWCGYHSDDGGVHHDGEEIRLYEISKKGDTVGCGLDDDGIIFFTKNGIRLGE